MSNEFAAQEIFNPAQDDYLDHQEHMAQTQQQAEENMSEYQGMIDSYAKEGIIITFEENSWFEARRYDCLGIGHSIQKAVQNLVEDEEYAKNLENMRRG
jgi:hypothetical protein